MIFTVTAQKKASIAELKKYKELDLYEEKSEMDVSGTWTGIETQYDRSKAFITAKYEYTLTLEQRGNRIEGTSYIVDASGNYSEMNLRGFVLGNKVHFEEYEITEEKMDKPYTVWCYTTGELTVEEKNGKYTLKGSIDGYASDNFRSCEEAEVDLTADTENLVYKKDDSKNVSLTEEASVDMSVYPNPFVENTIISYAIPSDSKVLLEVYDLQGKRLFTAVDENKREGNYQVNLMEGDFNVSSGLFLAVLRLDGEVVHSKQFAQSK